MRQRVEDVWYTDIGAKGSFGELDSKLPESSHCNIRTSSSQQTGDKSVTNRLEASHNNTVDMKLCRTTLRHTQSGIIYSLSWTVVTQ